MFKMPKNPIAIFFPRNNYSNAITGLYKPSIGSNLRLKPVGDVVNLSALIFWSVSFYMSWLWALVM